MTPLPWSHTALDDFVNCPRAYHEKRVLKRFKETETEQMRWGTYVHKAFEDRQKDGVILPPELEAHEPYLLSFACMPGEQFTERRVALDRKAQPCDFFAKDVWFRGVLDFTKIRENRAIIVDYKTGKPHNKFQQLKLFGLYIFAAYPHIDTVDAQFYWTQTGMASHEQYLRADISAMWGTFLPDLRQYAEAFKTDTWQPRQSGLCHGWCPVTDCEFWKPRRNK